MPRPPAKRSRPTTKAVPASTQNGPSKPGRDGVSSGDTPKASPKNTHGTRGASHLETSAQDSEIVRQLRSQTPMTKTYEQAVESSPATATGSRPPTRARGYSSTLSIAGRKGDMSSKVPGTPAFESSVLSNFRRRPRQPSILQMMQAEDGSSDLDDDFLGGLSPEDESTPLNLSRGKSLVLRSAASPSPSRHSLPSSERSRKRKLSTENRDMAKSPSTEMGSGVDLPESSGEESDLSEPPSPAQRSESPEQFNRTMRSPMSSSALSSPSHSDSTPTAHRLTGRAATRRKQAVDPKASLSTAILQDKFLPRRQQRHHDGTDLGVASDQDDDDLSFALSQPSYKSRRNRETKPKNPSSSRTRAAKQKTQKAIGSEEKANTRSSRLKQRKEQVNANPSTYRSNSHGATGMNKENQPVETSSPLSSPPPSDALGSESESEADTESNFISEELKLQAKKFAEVDRWEMEFEEVVVSGSQGSPSR
ncbi:hypothetical protein P168DRAFT_304344 [Aspergillus campestris IBT 28561]|uniref:Uncharacterized protein n=1 Tax=Aspergillus campestris (strain IBT 28561) TaxID=1392248 RepID=A0A2I1D638_ASPC2|nr:uncharacterized protein P168DRAFT_304344 [Aspergillus campestris IBT 28561]PKY05329.1 hypothetical protein P168DRAFT_304344 [Aspergillus campestris IBT 28561]